VKRALTLLFLLAAPVPAQVPRAEPVDPSLAPDAGNDFFQRAKNLYDTAEASTSNDNRTAYFQRAAQLFNDYIAAFPNHPNAEIAWLYLGNSYYQSGSIDDAKRCFNTLLNRYGKGQYAAAAAYTLAADHYNKAEYAFAVPLFERYATIAPKPEEQAKGLYFAGKCYAFLGRDREAVGAFKKTVDQPGSGLFAPQAKVELGRLALKDGRDQEALDYFAEVIGGPNSAKFRAEAALQGSLAATRLGKTDLADKYLQLILSTADMEAFRPDAQTALMSNYFAAGNYAKVIDVFRRSAGKAAGDKEAERLMIAGRAYMGLKQPSEAMQLFRDIEKMVKPEMELAFQASYYRLLCFYQIEGSHVPDQVDAFLQLYRKSHKDDPRIHTALLMKAESLYANKENAAAAKVYSEIDASAVAEDVRAGLLYHRGWCLAEAGDTQGAIRSLSEFIEKYPNDPYVPSAIAKRATAYVQSAESAKAIIDFDRLTGAGMPPDLVSFAWLESARLRRSEGNFADMIARYRNLLDQSKNLSEKNQAEADYFIGWGLVKSNNAKDAVPYLEKARELRPKTYRKHAGLLLVLGYFASQNPQKLVEEINLAIDGGYAGEIPDQYVQWSGTQAYNSNDFATAARFLSLVANPDEPRETPKEVWRYLAKARLKTGDAEGALVAVNNLLAVEDNPGWQADGLLDRGRALLLLNRAGEARKAAEESLALHPTGHTSAGLNILLGDLEMKAGDAKTAAGKYTIVAEFNVDDKELKPLALWKLAAALEKEGDAAQAAERSQQLKTEFPDWKPPGQ
jgi:tetratricopeptide (TPR) repeat protein